MSYITNTDYLIEIQKGSFNNESTTLKFGRNEDVGITREDIWDEGGDISYLSSAETMNVKSTDTNDTSTGTGARTLSIQGIDGSYNKVSETVTLNGTTNVETTNSYLRVYRMKVLTAGSGGKNAGKLTATASTAATVQAAITIGYNQTLMALYTLDADTTGYLFGYYLSINKKQSASADIELYVREFGGVFQLKHILGGSTTGTSIYRHDFRSPLKVSAKSDIIMRAVANATGVDISAGFDILEISS